MIIIIIAAFVIIAHSLDCSLYDYTKSKVSCTNACGAGSEQVGNYCLLPKQYIASNQIYLCKGYVSTDRLICCQPGQIISSGSCLPCIGQIYNAGLSCCPADHYLEYVQSVPNCVMIGTGTCVSILLTSPFKICCPSQQMYNVYTGFCTSTLNLNCDANWRACCPFGQFLDYLDGQYFCTNQCSWKASSLSSFACESQFCDISLKNRLVGPFTSSTLLSFTTQCCYALDINKTCLAQQNCSNSFSNRGWSICCNDGSFYVITSKTCETDCGGYILFGIICITSEMALDLRSAEPTQMRMNSLCNNMRFPSSFPICCPSNFYISDTSGCKYCIGTIFFLGSYQICCPTGSVFNRSTGVCETCNGVTDVDALLCCPLNTYVAYDINGNPSCRNTCPNDNIYQTKYCCDSLTASNCIYAFSPTLCSISYYNSKSCKGCPNFCSMNTQICSSTQSTCQPSCNSNEVLVANVGCLACDSSCASCTAPLDSSSCISCISGYLLVGNTCQQCNINCVTCTQFTSRCSSCLSGRDILYQNTCITFCQNPRTYFNYANLTCASCHISCLECTSSSSTTCTMCTIGSWVPLPVGTCQSCDASCLSCFSSSRFCIICSNGFSKLNDNTCFYPCLQVAYSIYISNELCISCHSACNQCANHPQNCLSCVSNLTYLDDSLGIGVCAPCIAPCVACNSSTSCLSCANGYYLNFNSCLKCDSSCESCNGPLNSNCLACLGTSKLIDGSCSGCSSSCAKCSNQKCLNCLNGYWLYNNNCLNQCPSKTYGIASKCLPCDISCDVCSQTNCTSCSSGYLYKLQSKCYSRCPLNYAPVNNICTLINNTKPEPPTPPSNQSKLNQPTQIVGQTAIIRGTYAYINIYFNTVNDVQNINDNQLTVNFLNSQTGAIKPFKPTQIQKINNRVTLKLDIPSQSLSSKDLIYTQTNGANSSDKLVSGQLSNQLLLNTLQSNLINNMKVMGYVASSVILIFLLLTKIKGHFSAEESNNIIMHTLNFSQVCYLFAFSTSIDQGSYFFLKGFGIAHLSFFPNFFASLISPDYVESTLEKNFIPDANLLRNAGFSFSYQLIVLGIWGLAILISYFLKANKNLQQMPQIRKIMRLGVALFHIGFMNELFFSLSELIHSDSIQSEYSSFYQANIAFSWLLIFLIPLVMGSFIYHFYQTYDSDVLEYYYTLRQAFAYLCIYCQSVVMTLAIGKPLVGLFLIPVECVWLVANYQLYKFGEGISLSQFKKYFVISGSICIGYLFLSLENLVNWIVIVVIISIIILILLVYCGYQLVGIHYSRLFSNHQEKDHDQ